MTEKTARDIIKEALDAFNVEDFIHEAFNDAAADKIIHELEWRNFKIIKFVRREPEPFVFGDGELPK